MRIANCLLTVSVFLNMSCCEPISAQVVGDCEAPKVNIVSPGSEVSGTQDFSADSSDNVKVSQVELFIDDVLQPDTQKDKPYLWKVDSSKLKEGAHTLKYVAMDPTGNKSSISQNFLVKNAVPNTPPSVPQNVAVKMTGRDAEITWTASKDDQAVVKYQVFQNGSFLTDSTDTTAYSKNLVDGTYKFSVKAVDAEGLASGLSAEAVGSLNPAPTGKPEVALYPDESCDSLQLTRLPKDSDGWTIEPKASRTIFVGAAPYPAIDGEVFKVKTFSEAMALYRKDNADHILLQKGQRFEGAPFEKFRGKDAMNPGWLGSYGSGSRPVLYFLKKDGLSVVGSTWNNVVVSGVELDGSASDASSAIRIVSSGQKNILFEDFAAYNFNQGLEIDAQNLGLQNFQIRRSQIYDNGPKNGYGGHSQGLYLSNVYGILIEENLFDRNGYIGDRVGATQFNHNIYMQSDCSCPVTKNNILSRASATGLQQRAGGQMIENLLVENPIHFTWGLVNGGSVEAQHIQPGLTGSVVNNVALNATDIRKNLLRTGQSEVSNAKKVLVAGNIIAHHLRGKNIGVGIDFSGQMGIGVATADAKDNILYDLVQTIIKQGPAFGGLNLKAEQVVCDRVDANNKPIKVTIQGSSVYSLDGIFRFNGCQSGIPASASPKRIDGNGLILSNNISTGNFVDPNRVPDAAWFKKVRALSRQNWDRSILAPAMNAWVREGFKLK